MSDIYNIEIKIISGVDGSRVETLGPSTGSRQVSAKVYYPTGTDEKFPMIVYNHGYMQSMDNDKYLCSGLASHGYIVVSVGHAYESSEMKLESGSVIKVDKAVAKKAKNTKLASTLAYTKLKNAKGTSVELYKQFLGFQKSYGSFMVERLEHWAKDVQAIVDEVKTRFEDSINLEYGIGITGHGFGGTVAYYLCQNSRFYTCGINIDGELYGHYDDLIMSKPFFQMCESGKEAFVSRSLIITEAPVYYAVYKKLGKEITASDAYSGNIMMNHMQFFDKHLKRKNVELDMIENDVVTMRIANKSKRY